MKGLFGILKDNGFEEPLADYGNYAAYDPTVRGCKVEAPFVINAKDGYVGLEYEMIDWILSLARGEDCQWRLLAQKYYSKQTPNAKPRHIDELVLLVDGQEEVYFFDITAAFEL